MRDLIRFVLRGAGGGVSFTLGLAILFYGRIGGFLLLSRLYFVFALLPGAVVGLFLWLIAGRVNKPLSGGLRFSAGTAVAGAYIVVASLSQRALTLEATQYENYDIPLMIMGIAVYAVSIGGVAGLWCPAGRENLNRKPELTYLERTRLYEAAEREAKTARERNASARVSTHPSGLTM